MDTPIDLDKLTHQTQRREYLDGLRDLHLGMVILILSLLNWFVLSPAGATLLVKTVRYNKDLSIVGMIGLLGLFILIIFGTERVMERIRRATLWKESGFVKPLRYGFNKWMVLAATVIMLAMIVGSTWLMATGKLPQETALRSIPAAASLGTGVFFFGMGRSLKLQRYKLVGVAGVLLSIFLYFYPLSFALTWFYLGIGWALILLASGIWALRLALLELKRGAAHE
jgi:uncharacterized membrane protein